MNALRDTQITIEDKVTSYIYLSGSYENTSIHNIIDTQESDKFD